MRILIVEDERSLLDQLKTSFEAQKYMVETASDGEKALDIIFDNPVDVIILDIMIPKIDGLTVLSEIRNADITTPVLMLTAMGEIDDRIKGLDLGADDYLVKPFSMDELFARVRALFRRFGGQTDSLLQAGELVLDTVSREVKVSERIIDLTSREFSILEFLLYNKNRAVSRFSLAEHVWGDDFDPFSMSNFMDVHIKNLRKKIGDSGHGKIIRTVRGIGYMIRDEKL